MCEENEPCTIVVKAYPYNGPFSEKVKVNDQELLLQILRAWPEMIS